MEPPKYRMNTSADYSLYNWIEQFDLECAPKSEFGLFGSIYFAGAVISSLIVPRISDKYGRKLITIIGLMAHMVGATVILFSHSLKNSLTMILLIGFAMGGRCFVGYAFMTEHMRTKDASKVTSATFFVDSLGIFVASIYFKFISKNWQGLWAFAMLMLIIPIIGFSR